MGRGLYRPRARAVCRRSGAPRAGALALPLAQAPEVAPDLPRVDLAPRQVQVGGLDQPPLVAGERHPLREHVVGVGQARAAVGPRLVRELDAVLVEQPAGLRQVGERSACAGRSGRRTACRAVAGVLAGPLAPARPHTRMKPRSRYIAHSSSFTHERSSCAGALLGAPLAAGVVVRASATTLAARAVALAAPRRAGGATTSHSSATTTSAVAVSASSTAGPLPGCSHRQRRRRRAGRRSRARRRAGRRRSCARAARRGGRSPLGRHGGPHARVELAAELLDQRAPRPRAPRRRPRRSAPRRVRASCAGTSCADYGRGLCAASTRRGRRPRTPEHVDGPGACADLAQAVADGGGGDGLRARAPPRAA